MQVMPKGGAWPTTRQRLSRVALFNSIDTRFGSTVAFVIVGDRIAAVVLTVAGAILALKWIRARIPIPGIHRYFFLTFTSF